MGNLRALSIALLAFSAACGDDGGSTIDAPTIIDAAPDAPAIDAPPDAPNYDFSCYENAAPTTATDTVQIAGVAQEVYLNGMSPGIRDSMGASIQACKGNCQGPNNLGTVGPTPTDGTFTTTAADTGGVPLDGYLIATKTGNRTTYVYPASPLTKDEAGVPVLMLSEALIPLLSFIGIDQDPGNSMFLVLVTDCALPPVGIGGATVTVTQGGVAVGDPAQSAAALDPQGEGAFFLTNVPPGDTTVNATYNGMTFRAHVVGAVGDTVTTTQVKPGF